LSENLSPVTKRLQQFKKSVCERIW